jgi:hypothetical protein
MAIRSKIISVIFTLLISVNIVFGQSLWGFPVDSYSGCSSAAIYTWVWGGEPPYTFQWSNGSTSSYLTNLPTGTYCLTLTDNACCQQTQCFQVSSTGSDVEAEVTSSTNPGMDFFCDGSIDIKVSGSGSPFTFQWSNGQTSEDASNLCTGNYTVTITSSSGCTKTLTAVIGQACYDDPANASRYPVNLTVVPKVESSINSFSNDGSIALVISSANHPYYINWTGPNGFKSKEQSLQNLSPGTYCVNIVDGCQQNFSRCFTINDCSQGSPINIAINSNGKSCNRVFSELPAGFASASASGGTGPYSFQWSNGIESKLIDNLFPGYYCVTATDSRSCKAEKCVTIVDRYLETQNQCIINAFCDGQSLGTFVRTNEGTIDDSQLNSNCKIIVNCVNGNSITLQGTKKQLPSDVQLAYCVKGQGCEFTINGQKVFILTAVQSQVYTNIDLEDVFTGDCPLGCKICVERTICALDGRLINIRKVSLNRCPPPSPMPDDFLTDEQIVNSIPKNSNKLKIIRTKVELDSFLKELPAIRIDGINVLLNEIGISNKTKNTNFSISPNPFSNMLTLEYFSKDNKNINVELVSIIGQVVYRKVLNSIVGKNNHIIELDNSLANGIYMMKILSGENSVHYQKLVKGL